METASSMEYPVFDRKAALERLGGCEEDLQTGISIFLEEMSERIRCMEHALGSGAFHNASCEAHAVRGGAGLLGAMALCKAALDLENACQSGDKAFSAKLMDNLREEFGRFVKAAAI